MEDELECSICKGLFGSEPKDCPRTLVCGHTFCTKCLTILFNMNTKHCPECRQSIGYKNISAVPVSITIMRIAEAHRRAKEAKEKEKKEKEEKTREYDECIALLEQIMKGRNSVNNLVKVRNDERAKDSALLSSKKDVVEERYRDLQKFQNTFNNPQGDKQGKNKNKNNKKEIANAKESIKQSIKPILRLSLDISKATWAVTLDRKQITRYAKISKVDNKIYLHCLSNAKPPQLTPEDVILPYDMVRSLAHKTTPDTFLELEWPNGKGTIEIVLYRCKRAIYFAQFCSGEKHTVNFVGRKFLRITDKGKNGMTVWGGISKILEGQVKLDDLAEQESNESLPMFQTRGTLAGEFSNIKNRRGQFGICLKDHKPMRFLYGFGKVQPDSLQIIDAISSCSKISDVKITDCGLVMKYEDVCA